MSLIKNSFILKLSFVLLLTGCFGKNVKPKEFSYLTKEDCYANLGENLVKALDLHDYKEAERLINEGANPNLIYDNVSLMYFFIQNKKSDLALLVMEKGADINWINPKNVFSLLSEAIYSDDLLLVKKISEKGIDIGFKDLHGQTYFSQCLAYKRYDCLDILLSYPEFEENIRKSDSSWYFLVYYWTKNTPNIIHRIYGNDVAISDDVPVLLVAIDENKFDAVKFFIDMGIDKNKKYYDERSGTYITPLQKAYQMEHFLLHFPSLEFRYSEDDDEILEIRSIIKLLSPLSIPLDMSDDIIS